MLFLRHAILFYFLSGGGVATYRFFSLLSGLAAIEGICEETIRCIVNHWPASPSGGLPIRQSSRQS